MKDIIETPRLILRELAYSDAQDLFVLDSDILVNKYLGEKPVNSIDHCNEIIRHVREQYQQNGYGRFAVVIKQTNEFIGWSGLKLEKEIMPTPYVDLGFRFIPKYWKKGYGFESAMASLRYGFNTLNVDRINAAAHVDNTGSNRLLQKAQMTLIERFDFEGNQHNWYEINRTDWLQYNQ